MPAAGKRLTRGETGGNANSGNRGNARANPDPVIRTDARGGINADARRCADARDSGIAGTDAGGHDNPDFNPNLGPCGLAPSATVAFTVANPDAGARRADRDKEPDG